MESPAPARPSRSTVASEAAVGPVPQNSAMASTAQPDTQSSPPHPQPQAAMAVTAPSSAQGQFLRAPDTSTQAAPSPSKRRCSPAPSATKDPPREPSAPPGAPSVRDSKRSKPEESPPKVLPSKYEQCATEDIVELVANMLEELLATNDNIPMSNGGLTRFHSRTPPGISVRDYLHRLAKHATLTPPLLLSMVYYIDRLCLMYKEFTINTLTVHRFLITAATVAAKGLSDSFWNNATYARVGGVRLAELKLLELEFLHRVDWKIVPQPEVLVAYYNGLVDRTPAYALETDDASDEGLSDEAASE